MVVKKVALLAWAVGKQLVDLMVIDLVVSMEYYKADKKVDWMGLLSVAYLENGKVVYSVDWKDV